MTLRVLILAALLSPAVSAQQVAPFEGYLDIPWGSSRETVIEKAKGELVKKANLNAYELNNSLDAKYAGYTLAPPTQKLVYNDKHGEVTSYYLCGDKLCVVDTKPANPVAFNPRRLLNTLNAAYGNETEMVKRRNLAAPYLKVKFDPKNEYLLTAEWDHPKGLVRAAIKTWPIEDMRQVYRVFYTSKPLMEANKRRLEEIVREKEEAARRAAEEARRAAEAAKAAKEAANP